MKAVSRLLHTLPLWSILLLLTIMLCAAMVEGLKLGLVELAWQDIVRVLLYQLLGIGEQPDGRLINIVWQLRLPRLLLSAAVGMGLTLSGLVMQAVVQNPLADPYILGISSGAALGTVLGLLLGVGALFGSQAIGGCAFLGAVLTTFSVVLLARRSKSQNAARLLLCGMAMSAVCSSMAGFFTYIGQNKEGMEAATFWLMGSTANARLGNTLLLLFLVVLLSLYFTRQTRILNLLLLGQEAAMTLGWDLRAVTKRYLMLNGLLVGFMVYNAGAIGFVGLLVPHFVRSFSGSNHRKLLPVAVLFGGVVATVMDIISRTSVQGVDIPLGVIFALLGAPCFIYLMVQRKYKFGG